jgi:xanthine dehydrogenase accessory factor
MRILIEPLNDRLRDAYHAVVEALNNRSRAVFVRHVLTDEKCGEAGIITHFHRGKLPPGENRESSAIAKALASGEAQYYLIADHYEGLAEPIIPPPRLLISGGGHVGQALARAAHLVGFEVVVIEDREEFSDPSLFGEGIQCRRGEFREALFEFPIDQDTYVALVGRGHIVDSKALLACLNSPAAYIGMMGSRRTVALVKREFIDGMLIDEEGWKKIHAPIGLDIGAETVPEIAASIVAQLIAVRRKIAANGDAEAAAAVWGADGDRARGRPGDQIVDPAGAGGDGGAERRDRGGPEGEAIVDRDQSGF